MKTQTYPMIVVMLLVCFVAGCSSTRHVNTRAGLQGLQADDEEPFMQEIKRAAQRRSPKKDNWYFWGDAAKVWAAQYDSSRRYSAPAPSEGEKECVPLLLLRF